MAHSYDPTNIFARILRGEIPNNTVLETEHTLAFPVDGLAGEGGEADAIMLAGLTYAREHGMSAPAPVEGSA